MGAFGTIKKEIENYTDKIPGNINILELQEITLLSEAHLLRQVLSIMWKPSLPPKVHGLGLDLERENHYSQLHWYDLYNHNYNKILISGWLSTALISALIGQFNRTVRVMPT